MNKPLILVVEDDAPIRNLITTTLKTQDYKLHCGGYCVRSTPTGNDPCTGCDAVGSWSA